MVFPHASKAGSITLYGHLTQFSMATPLVLSVEDNDGDFALMEFVLQECLDSVDLRRASDGEQAVRFLNTPENAMSKRRPDLILLDINIPRTNGFEILQFIRSQEFIQDAPVVMFTSSNDAREKRKALALGAEYITKPMNLDKMLEVLNEVCAKYLKKSDGPE